MLCKNVKLYDVLDVLHTKWAMMLLYYIIIHRTLAEIRGIQTFDTKNSFNMTKTFAIDVIFLSESFIFIRKYLKSKKNIYLVIF